MMNIRYLVISILAILLIAIVLPAMFGCATTTTTDPVTGNVSTSYDLNTDQITSLVGIGTNVWGLIQQAQAAQDAADANKPTVTQPTLNEQVTAITTVINALSGNKGPRVLTSEYVQTQAIKIALAGFTESGQFPPVVDIARYVASGTFPSERALIAFGKTGILAEQ